MISISQKVEQLVNNSPYLRDGLDLKLINLSALARHFKPQIEQELKKEVTETAIFMALQRYNDGLNGLAAANPGQFLGNLTLRVDLFEVTSQNSPTLMPTLSPLLKSFQNDRSKLFVCMQGIHETTIIASRSFEPEIIDMLRNETTIRQLNNLTAISLQRLGNHLEAVGVLMYPLRIIAWQGISVIEIVTTLNEIMIVIKDSDVDRAVVSVHQALSAARAVAPRTHSDV
jgi:hypothetical protein